MSISQSGSKQKNSQKAKRFSIQSDIIASESTSADPNPQRNTSKLHQEDSISKRRNPTILETQPGPTIKNGMIKTAQ